MEKVGKSGALWCWRWRLSNRKAECFQFRKGLPAFEDEREFRLTEEPDWHPFAVLESTKPGGPRFVCVKLTALIPSYKVALSAEDEAALAAGEGGEEESIVLGVVNEVDGGGLATNLAAPIVLSLRSMTGTQAVQSSPEYSAQTIILQPGERQSCS